VALFLSDGVVLKSEIFGDCIQEESFYASPNASSFDPNRFSRDISSVLCNDRILHRNKKGQE
jgi:hypothetical protein